ncbi:MAG: NUDIX domain-containing protein [Thermoplasmata archaeon]|nr:NUDIX domain-containing protein [Thermoplasmata archaeon]
MRGSSLPFRPDHPAVAELTAGAVISDRRGAQILLLHQTAEDRWCLPKGHVEPGESALAAALREVSEETGLTALDVMGEVGEVNYRFFDPLRGVNVFKTTLYFLAISSDATVRPEPGFDTYAWLAPVEAARRVKYETDRRMVTAAASALDARRGAPSS